MPTTSHTDLKDDQITLETPRLVLRPARPGDEIALFEIFKDVDVMRYW